MYSEGRELDLGRNGKKVQPYLVREAAKESPEGP